MVVLLRLGSDHDLRIHPGHLHRVYVNQMASTLHVTRNKNSVYKGSTAGDFSPDLGISGINLAFREFFKQPWDFYGSRKL